MLPHRLPHRPADQSCPPARGPVVQLPAGPFAERLTRALAERFELVGPDTVAEPSVELFGPVPAAEVAAEHARRPLCYLVVVLPAPVSAERTAELLDAGADDVLCEPPAAELVARLRALTRRSQPAA